MQGGRASSYTGKPEVRPTPFSPSVTGTEMSKGTNEARQVLVWSIDPNIEGVPARSPERLVVSRTPGIFVTIPHPLAPCRCVDPEVYCSYLVRRFRIVLLNKYASRVRYGEHRTASTQSTSDQPARHGPLYTPETIEVCRMKDRVEIVNRHHARQADIR